MGFIDAQIALERAADVHPSAYLYGKIALGENASIWINAAMRAEVHEIRIGAYTHSGLRDGPRRLRNTNARRRVLLDRAPRDASRLYRRRQPPDRHQRTLTDGVVVGENSIVAGHTILSENTIVPPNSIVMGVPGKVVKTVDNSGRTRVKRYSTIATHSPVARAATESGRSRRWEAEVFAELERLRRMQTFRLRFALFA